MATDPSPAVLRVLKTDRERSPQPLRTAPSCDRAYLSLNRELPLGAVIQQHEQVAAGSPGDDPIADIVEYRLPVFSPAADLLIAEIVALGGEYEIRERFGAFYWGPPSFKHELDSLRPMPDDLVDDLTEIRDRREHEARLGGWEVDRLLSAAREGRE